MFNNTFKSNLKITLNATRSKIYPLYLLVSPDPKISVHFRVKGQFMHFETSAANDSKMTLNTTRLEVLHICFANTHKSKFKLVSLSGQPFWVTCYDRFETSTPTNPQITVFNTKRSKRFRECSTTTTESQISARFALKFLSLHMIEVFGLKFQNSTTVGIIKKKIQGEIKFGIIRKRCWSSSVLKYPLPWRPMLMKKELNRDAVLYDQPFLS